MHATRQDELSTWQQIADYLGVGLRTAQNYEKTGLPIRRVAGEGRGRVLAYKAEIDRWKAERLAVKIVVDTSNGTTPEPELVPRLIESVEPPAFAFSMPVPVKSRIPIAIIIAALTVLLLTLGFFAFKRWNAYRQMSDFRVEGRNLIVVNAAGEELWRHTFATPLDSDFYKKPSRIVSLSWMGDLAGRGEQELLFLKTPATFQDEGTSVVCFDAHGNIQWEFLPGQRFVTDSGGRMGPPYYALALQVLLGRRQADTRIAVSSVHHTSQPDQVALLTSHGQIVGEYWHPGHLLYLGQADLDGDGRNELLLAGVDNGEHQATLVVLDPSSISGLSTPAGMRDQRFRLRNMPAAKEKAVVLFPRSCISAGMPYTRARAMHITKDRIIVEVAEGVNETEATPGFSYELDYKLRVISVLPSGIEVGQAHQQLEAKNILHHRLDDLKEGNELQAGVVVRKEY